MKYDPEWEDMAVCRGVGSDHTTAGEASKKAMLTFINDYCNNCPVVEQCDGNATPTDRVYTVRAGKLPHVPETSTVSTSSINYEDPEVIAKVNQFIERGECCNGHSITTDAHVRVRSRKKVKLDKTEAIYISVICRMCEVARRGIITA